MKEKRVWIGLAVLFAIIGVAGVLVCLIFNLILQKYKWSDSTVL